MEKYKATKVNDSLIELAKSDDLSKLYATIGKEENFILEWNENNVKKSIVIIGNNLLAKVRNGDIELKSQEVG